MLTDAGELERICDAMRTRGPDGQGQWFADDKRIALGHRRLSIIDLSEKASQPMQSADGNLVITFNGEIYNYTHLRKELIRLGHRFRSDSDTEVLLHLYAAKGRDMLEALRGMYAFAIWDKRCQGLFLARDPFGIKPLYYYDDGHVFKAASQVKALLAGNAVDTSPEPAGHVGFFIWGHVPEPYTLYRKIRCLPAGCCLWVDSEGVRQPETFHNITDTMAYSAKAVKSDVPSTQKTLRNALLDSVKHHLIADVPVGLFLSAGLDSATLAALASEFESRIITITLGFDEYQGTNNDETVLAQKVASRYGAQHHTIRIGRQDFEKSLDHFFLAMDQPTIDGLNTFLVSQAAERFGLKTAMSGLGGDELFGGYPSFQQIPTLLKIVGRWPHFQAPQKILRMISSSSLKRIFSPKYMGLFTYGGNWSGAYFLRRALFMPWELSDILDVDMVREGLDRLKTMDELNQTVNKIENNHLKIAAFELNWYLRNQLLRDADWAGMAHSVEIRVPFVDLPLLKLIVEMAQKKKVQKKRDMALTVSKPLPPEIFQRQKTGFTVPLKQWLMNNNDIIDGERGLRGWAKMLYANFN